MAAVSRNGQSPRSTLARTSMCLCSTPFPNAWIVTDPARTVLVIARCTPRPPLSIRRLSFPLVHIHIEEYLQLQFDQSHPSSSSLLAYHLRQDLPSTTTRFTGS
ncbi:hypothetical protein EJ02DRAFT_235480 [Clathrospora elynae]|uniref:Uncharacterized protein n=1 Tax=Clathrospora elynae TaxID=706981 RepID=A0A6A5T1Q4_9PLEO|nr:hypothetical protein EJ02DRAFT_235480 [Clathrospora elynae]